MKINKKNKNYRLKIAIATAALLITTGSVLAYTSHHLSQTNDLNSHPEEEQITKNKHSTDLNQEEDNQNTPAQSKTETATDTPPPITEAERDSKTRVMMTAHVYKIEGNIEIRGGIDNAVLFDGECYATLSSSSGSSIKRTTSLLQNPQTTDCGTIIIPVTDLSPGGWTIQLVYESKDIEGMSDEHRVEIE